jgi:hypothetical protein
MAALHVPETLSFWTIRMLLGFLLYGTCPDSVLALVFTSGYGKHLACHESSRWRGLQADSASLLRRAL